MKRCLVIMAKEPRPSQVKTRLGAQIGYTRAAELYRCFLVDTIALAAALPEVEGAISFWPREAQARIAALAPAHFHMLPQSEGDLGMRLLGACKGAFDLGCEAVVVIGSDSPSLPAHLVQQAFELLEQSTVDAVLGPSLDGGYYLIGMCRPLPSLFQGIAWSTDAVCVQTQRAAAQSGLRLHLLASWYDIDTPEDLARLVDDLRIQQAQGKNGSHTLAYLQQAGLLLGTNDALPV